LSYGPNFLLDQKLAVTERWLNVTQGRDYEIQSLPARTNCQLSLNRAKQAISISNFSKLGFFPRIFPNKLHPAIKRRWSRVALAGGDQPL